MDQSEKYRILKWLKEKIKEDNRTDADKKSQEFLFAEKLRRARFKSKSACMHTGCSEPAVRSHIFQKETIMRDISKNGKTIGPMFDVKAEKVVVKEHGVGTQSTFSGFCKDHEKMFDGFESRGFLVEKIDFTLQAYRSVCREISILENLCAAFAESSQEVKNKTKQNIINDFEDDFNPDETTKEFFRTEIDKIKFRIEDASDIQVKKYGRLIDKLRIISEKLYRFNLGKSHKNLIKGLVFIRKTIKTPLPLAVSGHMSWKKSDNDFGVFFMISFPNDNNQEVIFLSLSSDAAYLYGHLDNIISDDQIVSFVEKFTVSQTDLWFLHPDYYLSLGKEPRNLLDKIVGESAFDHDVNKDCRVFGFPITN